MTQRKQSRFAFYKYALSIAMPIAIQNLFSALVGSVDTVMLAYVSQDALSASALANQLPSIMLMTFGGLATGGCALVAQYWGKKDGETIEKIMGLCFKYYFIAGLIFSLAAILIPTPVMRLYTNQAPLIELGAQYLRIVGISYLLSSFSNFYTSMQRSMERVAFATAVNVISLLSNIFLNAVFIFGLFGAPVWGLNGVALATVIARAIEVALCVIDNFRQKEIRFKPALVLRKYPLLTRDFMKISLPAMLQDLIFGLGYSMYSVIFGRLGSDIVAANAVASTIRHLAAAFCMGVAHSSGIIIGKVIGEGDMIRAKKVSDQMSWLTFWTSLTGTAFLLLFKGPLIELFGADLTAGAKGMLDTMLIMCSIGVIGTAVNGCWIVGCFRAGGDAKFGMYLDIFAMWCWTVPLGFIAAFLLKLPPIWVYFILVFDEFAKMPVVIWHYRSYKWLKNITREKEEIG